MLIEDEQSYSKIHILIDKYLVDDDSLFKINISLENDVFTYFSKDKISTKEELEKLCKYMKKALKNELEKKINFKFILSELEFEIENISSCNNNLVVNLDEITSYLHNLDSESFEKLEKYIESVLKEGDMYGV